MKRYDYLSDNIMYCIKLCVNINLQILKRTALYKLQEILFCCNFYINLDLQHFMFAAGRPGTLLFNEKRNIVLFVDNISM